MSRVDQIADMIVREALERANGFDIPAKVNEVKIEVMLQIIDCLDGIRGAERRAGKFLHLPGGGGTGGGT